MNPTLDQLAKKFNTDKGNWSHSYTRWYSQILDSKRYDIQSVLELGVGNGASLKMWELYFPLAIIYGLDINDYQSTSERIITFKFPQEDEEKLKEFTGKSLDLIIDDACHIPKSIMISLNVLFDFLSKEGYYVIEDVSGKFIKEILDFVFQKKEEIKSIQIFASGNETIIDSENNETIIFIQKS